MDLTYTSYIVHTYYKRNGNTVVLRRSDIPHSVRINVDAFLKISLIDWCNETCLNPWGWYFDYNAGTFIGFSKLEDKILFCLTHDYS